MNEMTEARDHVNERLGCVAPRNPTKTTRGSSSGSTRTFATFTAGSRAGRLRRRGYQHRQRRRQYQRRPGGQRMHWEF